MRIWTLIAVLVLTLAGCSSKSAPESESTTTSTPPAAVTPVVGSVLAAPIPVAATDGRTHLAYELMLTNTSPGNVTLDSLSATTGDRKLLTLSGDNLRYWTRAVGNTAAGTNVLGAGQSAYVWLDVVADDPSQVPTELTHELGITVARPMPPLVGPKLTESVAPVSVQTRKPVSIAPPLVGDNWVDANGCCDMTPHRMALNPINGKLWAAERFAIDYVQLGAGGRIFSGDRAKVESYPYFGSEVHAVADGPVVAVLDGLDEQVPGVAPRGLTLQQYGGNHIVQDIGDGNYAFYAHLQPNSLKVKPGDSLSAGQVIGALGNSGNSDAPHLHFHVMDGPDPLASNGLPFTFGSFRLDSRLTSLAAADALFDNKPAARQPGFAVRDQHDVSPLVLDVMTYATS
ncbi:M23 family metallopeptidase [Mycobacterium sp. TNTM28]|uniref:M23 family metallopeptidase n=1 Tax=[Mycobacterium] fortunisiensis TaxID=2600579 RepID=A0ABS6KFT1_9MYCO|nr:M23 family metallopeptidase [[Mycobacterium] fortunisiensis]MBU9762395.1 M23 family metallopeptidase [[Mycobacterium] fortunisiensis]